MSSPPNGGGIYVIYLVNLIYVVSFIILKISIISK
jgi:hypothetical protein